MRESGQNSRTDSDLAVVLRSWEDRFRRVTARGRLRRHPAPGQQAAADPEGAQQIAAEHVTSSDEAHKGLPWLSEIALLLVNNPFKDFWWGLRVTTLGGPLLVSPQHVVLPVPLG